MKQILITSIAFLPNIGGVETHLKDLADELIMDGWKVMILTYQPIQTPVLGKWIERSADLTIIRMPVIRGWFYRLVDKPILEFLFLAPMHFMMLPIILIANPRISVINAQGLVAGFAAAFWSIVFRKRYVIALQNIYHFRRKSLYSRVAAWIIGSTDSILTQSVKSSDEVESLGVKREKIVEFTHWEDIDKFKSIDKVKAKEEIGLEDKFIVSFFGRLVDVKGINELLDSIKYADPKITFLVYGEGPLKERVESFAKKYSNLKFMGIVKPDQLPLHYSAADIVIMPSTHEEGFGRVAVGALLCSTPVIASNRGALPEIVKEKVGRLIEVTPENIAASVNYFHTHPKELEERVKASRGYAVSRFSNKNAKVIINTFKAS